MEKTEWTRADRPRWWLSYFSAVPFVAVVVMTYPQGGSAMYRWVSVAAIVIAVIGTVWATRRLRVSLTAEGVEVRRWRTVLYRWSDITSAEPAPAWDTPAVWLRTVGMHDQAAPEVLPLPRGRYRGSDQMVQQAVDAIRRRLLPERMS